MYTLYLLISIVPLSSHDNKYVTNKNKHLMFYGDVLSCMEFKRKVEGLGRQYGLWLLHC